MLGSYLPSQYGNVFALLARTLRSGHPAARAAIAHTALGVAAIPMDLLLRPLDRRLESQAQRPRDGIVIVCGPPRSGTTLVSQVLMRHLHVTYFSNLTNLFPRSPITVTRLFGRRHVGSDIETSSYYGKTRRLKGPNDALYLWDRWLGPDRQAVPDALQAGAAASMSAFFGAWQSVFPGPLVTKNNRLVLLAHMISEALPTTQFVCLRRDPVGLALSLLEARKNILGDVRLPYGAVGADYFRAAEGQTPERQVCLQVRHYEDAMRRQQGLLGPDRFRVLDYAAFCADPRALVQDVARRLPAAGPIQSPEAMAPFRHSPGRSAGADVRSVIEGHCRELGLLDGSGGEGQR